MILKYNLKRGQLFSRKISITPFIFNIYFIDLKNDKKKK